MQYIRVNFHGKDQVKNVMVFYATTKCTLLNVTKCCSLHAAKGRLIKV